jgi:hypothetical protein
MRKGEKSKLEMIQVAIELFSEHGLSKYQLSDDRKAHWQKSCFHHPPLQK